MVPRDRNVLMKKYYSLFIFLLVSCGGGGSSGNNQDIAKQNTAPELVGLIDFAIDENTTQVATFTATDAEGTQSLFNKWC